MNEKADIDEEFKYDEHKQLFLSQYEKVAQTNDQRYFCRQINHITFEGSIFPAHIQGVHVDEHENGILPTILTERPVNFPLSSFFESVASKKPSDDTFNLDQIKTVSSEQKF